MPMPRPRSAMRKIREVLRLAFGEGLSRRQVGAAVGLPYTTIAHYLERARRAGLQWPLAEEIDDGQLEARLYIQAEPPTAVRPLPDWATVHQELRRKGVTLQLLHLEYKERYPTATSTPSSAGYADIGVNGIMPTPVLCRPGWRRPLQRVGGRPARLEVVGIITGPRGRRAAHREGDTDQGLCWRVQCGQGRALLATDPHAGRSELFRHPRASYVGDMGRLHGRGASPAARRPAQRVQQGVFYALEP